MKEIWFLKNSLRVYKKSLASAITCLNDLVDREVRDCQELGTLCMEYYSVFYSKSIYSPNQGMAKQVILE